MTAAMRRRVLFAAWVSFVAAHLAIGAGAGAQRLVAHLPLLSSAPAVDWWLGLARFDAGGTGVSSLLDRVPPRDDILVVHAPDPSRLVPPWPFVSYLAWPRRTWVFVCAGDEMQPVVWPLSRDGAGKDPQDVSWVLFIGVEPPAGLRTLRREGRLTLTAADRAVSWRSYCSP